MKKHLLILIRTLLLILLDQISKYLFYDQNYLNNIKIIQPALNTGISRSLPIPQLITMILTIIIIAFVIYYYQKNKISKRAIMFIIGGSIGNLIDRIFLGGVRDFISVGNRFPIFNIADILINIGLIFVVLKEFFGIGQKYSGKTKNY